jgi:NADH-quinone oxidoreductase subunit A
MQEAYFSEFGEILLYIIGGILFVSITLLAASLIRPSRPNAEKLTAYESGEEPTGTAWTQFNVRFYVVALIFLLFEIEIVFLFPWATIFAKKELVEQTNGAWGWFSLLEMLLFIGILALGLAYVWVNGFLEWVKPNPSPTVVKSPVPKNLYERINQKYERVPTSSNDIKNISGTDLTQDKSS